MSIGTELSPNQAVILARALLSEIDSLTVGQAQFLAEFKLSDEDFERMNELSERASEGKLTAKDANEAKDFMQVGNLLEELKSRARRILRDAGLEPH